MWLLIFQRLTVEFFLDIFYFPVWWYTRGAKRAALGCWQLLQDGNATLAPGLWLRHILTPMFGQNDWQGRIMSFGMRLVNIIGRGFALGIWAAICLMLFGLWTLWPIFLVSQLVR